MIADGWGVGIYLWAEVAEQDERLGGGGVFVGDALFRGALGDEEFVFGEFVEAEEFRAVEAEFVGLAFTLHDDD